MLLVRESAEAHRRGLPPPTYESTPFFERFMRTAAESMAWQNPKRLRLCGNPQWDANAHEECEGDHLLCQDGSWRDVPGLDDFGTNKWRADRRSYIGGISADD